jgi:CBS domain-containing protein
MTLRTILDAKGDEVVSIDSGADLSAAAKLLIKRHIGAPVVLDAGERLSGILSERDIVRTIMGPWGVLWASRGGLGLIFYVSLPSASR